ncbi:hypothetical protein SAMN05443633_104135 [Chryseobacterium arachidis]|uniref:Uncharacterized protein n=1 Tax=Chryseobacterium arachidis TaxID=1416778 RepID=A0A1M5BDS6_9FLAO|nr:hypothetical protein [Chryseobacterium arachidis]SHF40713.1 hypothetical protein SAMN05443633_104135 [Chryseobacterium arachidis]
MDLHIRKLNSNKLFDFSKEEEKLIFEVFDELFKLYDISVVDIKGSLYDKFSSDIGNPFSLFVPKICYFVTDKHKRNSFNLFIVRKIEKTIKGGRLPAQLETLQIWGLKDLNEDFGYISINKKSFMDKLAGIFSSFNINFNDRDFKDFYVVGNDKFKTMAFLATKRKEIIKSFPDEDFKLEIKNNILSFGLPKELSVENALIVSKFLYEI